MTRPTRARLCFALLLPLALSLAPTCASDPDLGISSPIHGSFAIGSTVTVTGWVTQPEAFSSLTVNGVAVLPDDEISVDVPVSAGDVFNRILIQGTTTAGEVIEDTVLVVVGDGLTTGYVLDGEASPESVLLRIADTGLAQIAPIVESLSGDSLDIGNIISGQNPIASGNFSGIPYTANVVEVGFGGFGLDADAMASGLDTTITIDDFFLEVDLDLGFLGSCTLEIETSQTDIMGSFDLQPLAADPSFADVNLVSPVSVALGGFSSSFVGGICNDPLIGDIVNLIMGQGQIQQLMQDGFEDNLQDPDGAGPLDSPLAAAIQEALAGISIAGPVGEALGGMLDAPITMITEEANGLTLAADAAFYTTMAPVGPDLPGSYTVEGTLPSFGETTPDQGLPYGMAFGISTSALNQLLKTQIENGLLQQDITEFAGQPLTAGTLSLFLPVLAGLPPATPILIHIEPTLAPVFTGAPGPAGELALLKLAGLELQFILDQAPNPFLALQVDLDAGVDLLFTQAGLEFSLMTPDANDIDFHVVKNLTNTSNAQLVATFQLLFPLFAPELENAIDAFPIPSLLGLELDPVEVAALPGGFLGLFANLTQAPTTHIENVSFTDLSSGDFQQQGGCWLREWRHRIAGLAIGNSVRVNGRGMLGADAGCTTNDASSGATLAYRVNFDVVAVAGEQWTVDIDHTLHGSLDRISDGYTDGIGFQDGGGTATVSSVLGSWQVVGGASGSMDFTPSVTSISDGIGGPSSSEHAAFIGTNGVELTGSTSASVQLDFSVTLDAYSNSNTAFPTANGDEMAIRLGKNDTIDNNFIVGTYPGLGHRNIADDGHHTDILLTVSPLP